MVFKFYKHSLCWLLAATFILNTHRSFSSEYKSMDIDQLLTIIEHPSGNAQDYYEKQYLAVDRFLKGHDKNNIRIFLKTISRIRDLNGKLAALRALKNITLLESDCQDLQPLFKNDDALVRIAVADLLPGTAPWLERKVQLCVVELSGDEADVIGDPPIPACLLAKDILANLPQTKDVRKTLYSAIPKVEDRRFFHMVDLLRWRQLHDKDVFGYIGDVSPKDAKILRSWWAQNCKE